MLEDVDRGKFILMCILHFVLC